MKMERDIDDHLVMMVLNFARATSSHTVKLSNYILFKTAIDFSCAIRSSIHWSKYKHEFWNRNNKCICERKKIFPLNTTT